MKEISKKIFIICLFSALTIGFGTVLAGSGKLVKAATENFVKTEEGIKYIFENGVLTIQGNGSVGDVFMLFDDFEEPRSAIKSVVIMEGITEIPAEAFMDLTSLVSVSLPQGLRSIGDSAFVRTKLASITIPSSCIDIGMDAFATTEIESISLPTGMLKIKEGTFKGCTKLNSVSIPNTVKEIEKNAFYECLSLKSITIPNSVEIIGEFALGYTISGGKGSEAIHTFNIKGSRGTMAEIYAVENNFKLNGDTTHTDKYVGYEKVKYFPKYEIISKKQKTVCFTGFTLAKKHMKHMISYKVPDTIKIKGVKYKVTRISGYVFEDCKNLREITIGKYVSYISSGAFAYCKKMNKIILKSKGITTVVDGALSGTSKKLRIKCPVSKKNEYKNLFQGKGNKTVRIQ